MQIEIVYVLEIVFWATALAFTFYLLVKMCTEYSGTRPVRRVGMPKEEDLTSTEGSYNPGWLGSSARVPHGTWNVQGGSSPVGYKEDRPPTRSFRSYTDPRREEEKRED